MVRVSLPSQLGELLLRASIEGREDATHFGDFFAAKTPHGSSKFYRFSVRN